ncbi:MAG: tetratricopeptide repeat protein [Pseudobdellovibrio sp.]
MMKTVSIFNMAILINFMLLPTLKSWSATLSSQVKLQGETLNFEISGQKNWDYDLKRVNDKILLTIKNSDKTNISNLKNLDNPFVKSIKILPNQLDGFSTIEFSLASKQVEAFDYLTEQPSKLVVDFYLNEDFVDKNIKKENVDIKGRQGSNPPKLVQTQIGSLQRKPAQVDFLSVIDPMTQINVDDKESNIRSGLFDGGDEKFDRFKLGIIDTRKSQLQKEMVDYYLRYPLIERDFDFWTLMKQNKPEYEFKANDTDEYKQAKLIKVLFDKKRYLVMRKTTDWFEKKFKTSDYLENIYFMNADAMYDMYLESNNAKYYEDALSFYAKALQRFPNSKLKERTSLLVAMIKLDKKDYLSAVRLFDAHINEPEYKNKQSAEYAKLGMAYSLSKLNKLDEALKNIEDLENNAKNVNTKAEAALRKGDYFAQVGQYEKAADAYSKSISKFEKQAENFPSTYFNFSEVLFRDRKPEQAHAAALNFVKKFPSHEYAPYALTRVGELLEVLGAEQSKAVGAYLETNFRYGDSPKTIIAKLHLLSTRMKVMKDQEVQETLSKMDELASKSDLQNVDQFKVTMISDGFSKRNEYQKALDQLITFYQKDPNRPDSSQIFLRISQNINSLIKKTLDSGDYKSVLSIYQKYSDTWIKKQPRIDTDFYVAKAYLEAGAYSVALNKFNEVSQKILDIGKNKDVHTTLTQNLPTSDEINLMKALCLFEEGQFKDSFDKMKLIDNPEKLSDKDQINRIYYTALMADKRGDYKNAIRYLKELSREWSDKPNLLGPALLKLSDFEIKNHDYSNAKNNLNKIIQEASLKDQEKMSAYRKMIEIAHTLSDTEMSKEYLAQYIEKYGQTKDLSTERYQLGEIYFNAGQIQKAESIWSELKSETSSTLSKLAASKLNDIKWKDENKKYLKRIPAMTKSEKNSEDSK